MNKKNVLVFPACSELGLEINRSIANSEHFNVIGLSSGKERNNADFLYNNNYKDFPKIDDDKFINLLNEFVEKHSIDFIFPAHDLAVLNLSKNSHLLKCEVLASEYNTCAICLDKLSTYTRFNTILNIPILYGDTGDIKEYPVFLKPTASHGAIGTHIAYSKEEVDFYISKNSRLICMEYLSGKEYTIDCFTDRKGALLFVGARERRRIFAGMSSELVMLQHEKFNKIAKQINEELNLRGAWFFQVKENAKGEVFLLEIEPRVSGGNGLYRNYGINLPLMSLYDKMGRDLNIIQNKFQLIMNRTLDCKFDIDLKYENVYVDLDGTLIMDEKINIQLMAFLFQCINKNIKIHLITSHENKLHDTLKKYRLESLFDSIIWIQNNQTKDQFHFKEESIFIDNSYRNRYSVWKKKNIPVFDVNSIECLIDYRRK